MIDTCLSTVKFFALLAIFEIFSNKISRKEEVPLFFFKNLQMLSPPSPVSFLSDGVSKSPYSPAEWFGPKRDSHLGLSWPLLCADLKVTTLWALQGSPWLNRALAAEERTGLPPPEGALGASCTRAARIARREALLLPWSPRPFRPGDLQETALRSGRSPRRSWLREEGSKVTVSKCQCEMPSITFMWF